MAAKQRVSIVSAHVVASRREHGTLTPVATKKEEEEMKDEYSNMSDSGLTWKCSGAFELECGQALQECEVGYNTYGTLNETRDNAIFVCHALTGNSQVDGWWGGLIGEGKAVDTKKYFVVCANVLGSCYGTAGPTSINPQTGEEYGPSFPAVTIRDTVRLHRRLMFEHLKVRQIALAFGGSMGGMQVLEWLCLSERLPTGEMDVRRGLPIACGAAHTSWQIGISETQRNAIFADPRWNGGSYEKSNPPTTGLMIARQIAMITYRTSSVYKVKFPRDNSGLAHRGLGLPKFPRLPSDDGSKWKVQSYLDHQGEKFRYRFDPLSYVRLTALMDSQDIGRGRGGIEKAMAGITQPVAVVAISSDVLYPVHEQQELVQHIPNSELWMVDSLEGHDAFILETEQIGKVCSRMLDSKEWVPRRNVTTYCTSFTSNDKPRTEEEQKFHETEAAEHRVLADFHEQQKSKPKTIPAFWL